MSAAEIAHVRLEQDIVHISPSNQRSATVEVGCNQPVTIDKMFGPLIFANIRATADFSSGEWVIERQRIDSMEWEIVARFPGQKDEEFDEGHPNHREIASDKA